MPPVLMRAIECPQYGPPEVLRLTEMPVPAPGAGEVLVRLHAAGVNFPDILAVSGDYPIPSRPPFVPGIEGAGVVAAVGDGVDRVRAGDRVCWQDNQRKGAFADFAVLPGAALARIPEGIGMAEAAAVPTVFGTAAYALFHRGGLKAGETVLIHGASGGVGIAAVQLALRAGARIIALSASAGKRDRLAALGVQHVLPADAADLRAAILGLTGGRGVDMVLDMVGGPAFDLSMRVLAPLGRLLSIGFTSGILPVAKVNILLVKGISVVGVNYGHHLATCPDAARATIEECLAGIAAGRMQSPVSARYPLEAAAQALRDLSGRAIFGKAVLEIADPASKAGGSVQIPG